MATRTYGAMAVDWEQRIDFDRLRHERLARAEDLARKIATELRLRGLEREPLGVDVVEIPILRALEAEGLTILDGQQLMSDARMIKTDDEISLLAQSAMMVDAAYDELYRAMKPGFKENEAVG